MVLLAYSRVVSPYLACAESVSGTSCVCTKQSPGESAKGVSPANASLSVFPVEMFLIRTVTLDCDLDTLLHSFPLSAYWIRRCGRRKGCKAYKPMRAG
jgi:hypothetical protein